MNADPIGVAAVRPVHGMRVPCEVAIEGAGGVARSRAGLGSGLELTLPSGLLLKLEIRVNVPVAERFAGPSACRLDVTAEPDGPSLSYEVVDDGDGARYPIRLPGKPSWHWRQRFREVPPNRTGAMQGA